MSYKNKNVQIGDTIKIIEMKDEPSYKGRIGKVEFIDAENQLHGTWGGLALIPNEDDFMVIEKGRKTNYQN